MDITWAKRHSGIPGNERADKLAGEAAEKQGPYGVHRHVPRPPQTQDLRAISEGQREVARWPRSPWDDGDPSIAPQEVLSGQSEERHSSYSGADPVRALALGGVPQNDPEADRRQVLRVFTLENTNVLCVGGVRQPIRTKTKFFLSKCPYNAPCRVTTHRYHPTKSHRSAKCLVLPTKE